MSHTVHDRNSAPAEAGQLLAKAESAYGFVPNLPGVINGVGMKTLSNCTKHIGKTPLDRQFGG